MTCTINCLLSCSGFMANASQLTTAIFTNTYCAMCRNAKGNYYYGETIMGNSSHIVISTSG